ncbi:hypothetical protein D3C86_1706370 [compost metagenome]
MRRDGRTFDVAREQRLIELGELFDRGREVESLCSRADCGRVVQHVLHPAERVFQAKRCIDRHRHPCELLMNFG